MNLLAALPLTSDIGRRRWYASFVPIVLQKSPSGLCEIEIWGLRGIEWVIFEVKAREKRGLRRDSAFRGMGYLA
jgi:hypothetical protein